MADVRHNLVVDTSQSQMSLRQMRQELKNLQVEMSKTTDPVRFKQLEKEFAKLRNDMSDTSKAMKYLDPGELLGGYVKLAQGAVGSFAAITGAMSLFGNESEKIQQIEKDGMALIQTMIGLEKARQLLIDGGGRAQIKTLLATTAQQYKQVAASVIQWTTQKALNASTIAGSVAFKGLGMAMKAVPFIAIGAAVVGIVTGLINMGKKTEEAADKTNYMTDTLKDAASGASDVMSKIDIYSRKLIQAKGNKNDFAKAVKDYNDNIAVKYNTSLLTTSANLDDIARAAKEARANIWNMAVVEAGQSKMKQIWAENFDALMVYNQAQEDAANLVNDLNAAQKAYDDKWKGVVYDPWQDARGAEQQKEMEKIAALQSNILLLQEKGTTVVGQAQSDLFKQGLVASSQIASLLNTIDAATNKITVSVNKTGTSIKQTTNDTKELKNEFEDIFKDIVEFTFINKKGPQQITEQINELKKNFIEARNQIKSESLFRALDGEEWDIAKEKMMDYYGQGIISEEEYNKKLIDYASKNLDANEEAFEYGLIGFEEFEKNKTQIAKAENDKRKALIQNYSNAYQDVLSSANNLITAIGERELIGVEANSKKGLQIRKKQAKQQLAMQVAMSAGLIAASFLQAIAQEGPIGLITGAALVSTGAAQVAAIIKAQNAIDQIDVEIANLADGGLVIGRGGPRSDSIPANLSNGEFVLNAAAVERLGLNLVNSLNKGASTAALIDYDLLAEKINNKQVYVTDKDITERQRTTKVTEKRTRL